MDKKVFGVDIGGTTIKMGVFSGDGELIDKWEIPTRTEDNGSKILPDIAASIRQKMEALSIERTDVAGIGISVPGPVDDNGIVHKCVNLGWGVFDIDEEMKKYTGVPVFAGNDANAAALGEVWRGGGKGYNNAVVVTLGTGVGGGIIVNGKILSGSSGAGGEIGHILVNREETKKCGCGNKGCLEQYASATGIARMAKAKLAEDNRDSVMRNAKSMNAKVVFDAVKAGDAVAMEVAEEFGRVLGIGLAIVADVVNPEVFVIGGGVSRGGQIVIDYIEKNYNKYVFHASRGVKFALATLGNDAGIYGSAKLVIDGVSGS
ncbi:MAG: ROK family glucokinase [Lachnospiraceae bacterium]|nr:ROK family glucokinase [Lachnospiraceae bacterium]